MEHIAHVGLVDPHAEGDRCHDHHPRLGHEEVLVRLPVRRLHAGVIGQRADPVRCQQRRRLFGLPARQAVDDAALAFMAGDEVAQLPFPVPLHLHGEPDVRTVEPEHELFDRAAEQPVRDIVPGHLVGGRRQRGERNAGKEVPQPAQVGVFRPEGRAPLRDAMRLVDGKQPDRQALQRPQHALGHQPFRRHVEQPRGARLNPAPGGLHPVAVVPGMDGVRGDAREPERRHLVLHQRDQRRHHDREAVHDQCRDLEAQRLARARRHHGKRVAPRQQGLDHPFLSRTERREPEHFRQHPACSRHRVPRPGRAPDGQATAPVPFSHPGSLRLSPRFSPARRAGPGIRPRAAPVGVSPGATRINPRRPGRRLHEGGMDRARRARHARRDPRAGRPVQAPARPRRYAAGPPSSALRSGARTAVHLHAATPPRGGVGP